MHLLTLDIGNTAAKLGYFVEGELVQQEAGLLPDQVVETVSRLCPDHAIIATVATRPVEEWVQEMQPYVRGTVLPFSAATTAIPLQNAYATPHTLGADRLAAAVGAATLFPRQDALILDAGTALKADWVEGGHTFRGGSIAPGLQLRFQALHTFTGRLPLISAPPLADDVPLTGTDTQSAIRSGVVNGMAAEMNGILAAYRQHSPHLAAVLTGGDGPFFEPRLKGRIFAIPELVLLGLHRILVHNVK
ncbi:type III pantothenate kinase [Hymenobacter sp. BT730]|uniref:type III pantothenate kinase n=1 Tax=Hymenobacter sp. BT730 TaxID=3063332 RepID=UPI0026DF9EC7|nr:type III pantothenate kinase [Hymenobacter sp. BT730]